MPAVRRRGGGRRRFRRRKQLLPKREAKGVKALITRALRTNIETKARYVQGGFINMYGGKAYAMNPFYWIPNDVSLSGLVGDKMAHPVLHLKAAIKHVGIQVTGQPAGYPAYPWPCSYLRVLVVKHPNEWANGTEGFLSDMTLGLGNVIQLSDVLRNTSAERTHLTFRNPQGIQGCIFDKTYPVYYTSPHIGSAMTPQAGSLPPSQYPNINTGLPNNAGCKTIDISVKFPNLRKSNLATSLTGYMRENYYIIFVPSAPAPTAQPADNLIDFEYEYVVSWKDA